MMQHFMNCKTWIDAKVRKFMRNERGDVNIVSIVVLIGVAVILAILFKDAIGKLLTGLLESIRTKGNEVATNTLPPISPT